MAPTSTGSLMKRLGRAASNSRESKNGTDEKIEHDIGTNWQYASALGIATRIIVRSNPTIPALGKFVGNPEVNYPTCHLCINICSSYFLLNCDFESGSLLIRALLSEVIYLNGGCCIGNCDRMTEPCHHGNWSDEYTVVSAH
ncbi:hypothetical protein WUBG_08754 [Wuchereria bancrofti]|uniref:Uncharacterized protein n=1 Tax=Wuchereria bancrofti TaxID=6293 RepID=J9EYW9_WUCBA|nr:hypothetical protein WUBG_08754 [Wuchereria bancrofti]